MLRDRYKGFRRIYLSWDAVPWHRSKALFTRIEALNQSGRDAPEIQVSRVSPWSNHGSDRKSVPNRCSTGMKTDALGATACQSKARVVAALAHPSDPLGPADWCSHAGVSTPAAWRQQGAQASATRRTEMFWRVGLSESVSSGSVSGSVRAPRASASALNWASS